MRTRQRQRRRMSWAKGTRFSSSSRDGFYPTKSLACPPACCCRSLVRLVCMCELANEANQRNYSREAAARLALENGDEDYGGHHLLCVWLRWRAISELASQKVVATCAPLRRFSCSSSLSFLELPWLLFSRDRHRSSRLASRALSPASPATHSPVAAH